MEAYDIAWAAMVLAVPVFALIHPRLTLSHLAFSGLIPGDPRVAAASYSAQLTQTCGGAVAAAIFVLVVRFRERASHWRVGWRLRRSASCSCVLPGPPSAWLAA